MALEAMRTRRIGIEASQASKRTQIRLQTHGKSHNAPKEIDTAKLTFGNCKVMFRQVKRLWKPHEWLDHTHRCAKRYEERKNAYR